MFGRLIIFQLDMSSPYPVDNLEIVGFNIEDDLAFLNTALPLVLLEIAQRKILMRR